jgi:hypothetical protein
VKDSEKEEKALRERFRNNFKGTDLHTPKTPSQRKYINIAKILTDTEIEDIGIEIHKEIKGLVDNGKTNINVKRLFFEYLKREKILVTNFCHAWNPYEDNPKDIIFYDLKKITSVFLTNTRFITSFHDPKEVRNLKLRRKRRERRERGIICYCKECEHEFTAVHRDKQFCSKACQMRSYRKEKKES